MLFPLSLTRSLFKDTERSKDDLDLGGERGEKDTCGGRLHDRNVNK